MYRLYSFDGLTLPDMRSEFQADTGQAWNGAVALPGGATAFDSLGSAQAPLVTPRTVEYSSLVTGASLAGLEATLGAWRGKVGVRGLLRRRLLSSAVYQDITARLLEVSFDVRSVHSHGRLLPVRWRWQVLEEFWRGGAATVAGYLTTGLDKVTVANAGNAVIRDAVITLKSGLSAITWFNVTVAPSELIFSGTVAGGGKSVVIDCGAQRIRREGVDVYGDLSLGSGHNSADWLPLLPGSRDVWVVRTGGDAGASVQVDFRSKYV